jgi:riboflavin synthase
LFTGLVAGTGTVQSLERDGAGVRLRVRSELAGELGAGDSVAVNGVCLTAIEPDAQGFSADVMEETLRRSSLGPLGEGDAVNLELPLRAGDRLGGHIVQGHVDATGEVVSVREEGLSRVLRIAASADLLRYIVEKGSIAVEGVSLTVSAVDGDAFEVSLIPETLERTTLGAAAPGRTVNLEVDVLAKYVEKAIRSHSAEPSARGQTLKL